MIHNDSEYKAAVERLRDEKKRLGEQEVELRGIGLTDDQLKRALDPMRSFYEQLSEEVEAYEKVVRREFDPLSNLRGLGHLLVTLRIAQGISQAALAKSLGVDPSQVSRDERNEYRNITLERAARVLEALGAQVISQVKLEDKRPAA